MGFKVSLYGFLAGLFLILVGIIVIVIENGSYAEHGSYGTLPIMLGALFIFISSFGFIKSVIVRFFTKEEEDTSFFVDDVNVDDKNNVKNKHAKSVITRNR
ncbi:MAG: hypothetical protein L3J51_01165 [Cocleimonas sp.]|nr:hypothetical protein [Cocleimonas sp.]